MKRKTQQTGNPSTAYLEAAFNSGFFYHHQRFPHSRKRRRGKWLSLSLSLLPPSFLTLVFYFSLFLVWMSFVRAIPHLLFLWMGWVGLFVVGERKPPSSFFNKRYPGDYFYKYIMNTKKAYLLMWTGFEHRPSRVCPRFTSCYRVWLSWWRMHPEGGAEGGGGVNLDLDGYALVTCLSGPALIR